MINYKKLISLFAAFFCVVVAIAQTSTNSPYTRYGFGQLEDQGFGRSKAMGGVGYGLRSSNQINILNPASYSAIDSLTLLFDAGVTLQNTNFKEGSVRTNAKNSSFDYLATQFRLTKGMGMTIGILPFSTVGYSLSNTKEIDTDEDGNSINSINSYSGDGGLHQIFVGVGYSPIKDLSVGANVSYLYGDISHSVATAFNTTSSMSSVRMDKISVSDYKLDLGLQYSFNINKNNKLNFGLVYSYGHDLNSDGYKYIQKYSSTSSLPLTETADTIKNAFSIPHNFGFGVTYMLGEKLTVGADFSIQKWSKAKFFDEKTQFTDKKKVALGAEYIPNSYSHNYLKRVRYRLGGYISNSYTKVDGQDGAREYGVSAGFGLPLFQSKSILNISGQYIKVSPKVKGMLEENSLRINIGLTFNERWFMKYKVD